MTDQMIPTDQARRARQWARDTLDDVENGANVSAYARDAARTLMAMMPRPTLADMTEEERAACMWMQADAGQLGRVVIVTPDKTDNLAQLIDRGGSVAYGGHGTVTPRPDLPRMEWPGTEKPAPALPDGWRLADHKDYGRVIVTTQTPDRDGYVYVVIPDAGNFRGYDWHFCAPDTLTYINQEADTPTGPDHLAVGTVIESADDPRIAALPDGSVLLDRDRETVGKRKEVWMGDGYIPRPSERDEFGPWTVRRIGWEDDQ